VAAGPFDRTCAKQNVAAECEGRRKGGKNVNNNNNNNNNSEPKKTHTELWPMSMNTTKLQRTTTDYNELQLTCLSRPAKIARNC
jgi:hypothetical protein